MTELMHRSQYLELCRICEEHQCVRSLGPIKLNIELTSHCNWKCAECPQPGMEREKRNLPFDFACGIIDQHAHNRGYYLDLFLFGEPLLYPRLIEVIKYAVKRIPMVHLNTNGSLVTPGMAGELVDSGIHGITVSALPSAGDVWKKAVRNLRDRRDAAHKTTPFLQVQATERHEITDAVARSAGADALVARILLDLGRKAGIRDSGCRRPCAQLWRHLCVMADGNVTPCCGDAEGMLKVGNAADDSIRDIWNGKWMQHLRSLELAGDPVEFCSRCPDRDRR